MNLEKNDIETREDVILLVNKFYARVRQDALIGPIFNETIGKHWAEHLEKLYDFWESRLFDRDVYEGRPLFKHIPLPIGAAHFERWLKLWNETIDDYFVGDRADEARRRADSVSQFFQERLAEIRKNNSGNQ